MFTKDFDRYVCEGDTITCHVDGFDLTARIYRDDCSDRPDERQDGFWPSLDPQSAGYIGPKSQRTLDRHMARAKAVMNAWLNDEWFYCGVAVTAEKNGITVTDEFSNALWGIECNYPTTRKGNPNTYLREVANEYVSEVLAEAHANIASLVDA